MNAHPPQCSHDPLEPNSPSSIESNLPELMSPTSSGSRSSIEMKINDGMPFGQEPGLHAVRVAADVSQSGAFEYQGPQAADQKLQRYHQDDSQQPAQSHSDPFESSLVVTNGAQWEETRQTLDEARSKYTYNPRTGNVNIVAPTFVHSACTRWFTTWGEGLNGCHTTADREIEILTEATLDTFQGVYKGFAKVPDAALYPQGRRHPTVVLEAGYSESYTQLLEDATLLLEGTGSRVSYVILVKVSVLKPKETSVSRAFVELHSLNPVSRNRVRLSRHYLHGPNIQLNWNGILRNHLSDYENLTPPPPLDLRVLQRMLNNNAKRSNDHRQEFDDEDSESEWF